MAWNTGTSYNAASVWGYTQANGVGNDLRTWGGAVDGGSYTLSNLGVLTFAAGGYINSSLGIGAAAAVGYKLNIAAIAVDVNQSGGIRIGPSDQYSLRPMILTTVGGVPYAEIRAPKDASAWLAFTTGASDTERMRIYGNGVVKLFATPVYADNTAAVAGGLTAGMQYRTSTGVRMEVY